MKQRCLDPAIAKIGTITAGEELKYRSRWLTHDGLLNFLADMGERPTGMTLERIDNNGDYEHLQLPMGQPERTGE